MFSETNHVAAARYGFTDEELDFIPSTHFRAGNYDIQYRMDETRTLPTFSGLSRNLVR